jgi:hypothetical protein
MPAVMDESHHHAAHGVRLPGSWSCQALHHHGFGGEKLALRSASSTRKASPLTVQIARAFQTP